MLLKLISLEGKKLYSILYLKCPRCHKGKLFNKAQHLFKGMLSMPSKCSHCNQDFDLEPGFYSGALYVSYALIGLYILPFIITGIRAEGNTFETIIFPILIVTLIILQAFIMRFSRAIWLNFFIHFDKNKSNSTDKYQ